MNFSENQVRQVYVANSIAAANTDPKDVGAISACGVDKHNLYFKYIGPGGEIKSDNIPVKTITSASLTKYANLCAKLQVFKTKITKVVVGQTYTFIINFQNYVGIGNEDMTSRVGAYTCKTGDDAKAIAKGLCDSLSLSAGDEGLFGISVNDDTITVQQVEQVWERGKIPYALIPFTISLGAIIQDGVSISDWGETTKGDPIATNSGIKQEADLEYFAHGERGDVYRGMGYPYDFNTTYMIDMSKTYDILSIHYAYLGNGVDYSRSEKDIQILVPAGDTTLAAEVNTLTGAQEGNVAYIPFQSPDPEQPAVSGIAVDTPEVAVQVGGTVTANAIITPANADQTIEAKIDDASLATVSVKGNVITIVGVKAGTAKITINSKADPTKTALITATINLPKPTKVNVDKATVSVVAGATASVTPTVDPAEADQSVDVSSSDETIATAKVSDDKKSVVITGVKAGTANITLAAHGDNTVKVVVAVTVTAPAPPAPTGVKIDNATLAVNTGAKGNVVASVDPAGADQTLDVTSSDTKIATVALSSDKKSYEITGVAAGTANIVFASHADATKKATCAVTVSDPAKK